MSPESADRLLLVGVAGLAAGARWPALIALRWCLLAAALAVVATRVSGRGRSRTVAVGGAALLLGFVAGSVLAQRSIRGLRPRPPVP